MIDFFLVDIKSITSDVPRSNFDENKLDSLADLILETGGLVKPLLLKKVGADSYEVIDTHFEYYAAVRAKEKNPRKAEMVNALVVPPESEKKAHQQIETLSESVNYEHSDKSTSFELRLTNLELRIERQNQEAKENSLRNIERIEEEIEQIKKQLPQKSDTLKTFNTLNSPDLIFRLSTCGITGKKAESIVEQIIKKRKNKFESLRQIVENIDGLSDKKMVDILDIWSKTYFD